MKEARSSAMRVLIAIIAAAACGGCVEAKLGVGPFKAGSVEVGPGGVEAKGPSAGPFGARGTEARRDKDD